MDAEELPERLVIDDPKQLACLTSPVRLEMLETFGVWGPCGVADVARRMERAPDSLYYHLRKLVEVGLLEHVKDRRRGHRFEALYRLPARDIEVDRRQHGEARVQTSKAIHAVLRLAGRELDDALDDESVLDEGPKRRLYGRRLRGRLSQRAIAEINRHVSAIEAVFAREQVKRKGRGGLPVALTLVMTPGRGSEDDR